MAPKALPRQTVPSSNSKIAGIWLSGILKDFAKKINWWFPQQIILHIQPAWSPKNPDTSGSHMKRNRLDFILQLSEWMPSALFPLFPQPPATAEGLPQAQ